MVNRNSFLLETLRPFINDGARFNANRFGTIIRSKFPSRYLVDFSQCLKDLFGVSIEMTTFGLISDKATCYYEPNDKILRLNESLDKEQRRAYIALCLANLILNAVSEIKYPTDFRFYKGKPIYEAINDKRVFDLAVELLSDEFKPNKVYEILNM